MAVADTGETHRRRGCFCDPADRPYSRTSRLGDRPARRARLAPPPVRPGLICGHQWALGRKPPVRRHPKRDAGHPETRAQFISAASLTVDASPLFSLATGGPSPRLMRSRRKASSI